MKIEKIRVICSFAAFALRECTVDKMKIKFIALKIQNLTAKPAKNAKKTNKLRGLRALRSKKYRTHRNKNRVAFLQPCRS
jgi:hypothetical protein